MSFLMDVLASAIGIGIGMAIVAGIKKVFKAKKTS